MSNKKHYIERGREGGRERESEREKRRKIKG
jgi:hypothetical protein